MEASDAEDELGDWLDERSVAGAWDLAPVLVAGGLDAEWLDKVERAVPEGSIEAAVRWIAYTVETETLMGEITDATGRIANLVGAARSTPSSTARRSRRGRPARAARSRR